MFKISEIRRHLRKIPGAMEDGEESLDKLVGDAPGLSLARTVWNAESPQVEATLIDVAPDAMDSDDLGKPQVELGDQLIFETPSEIELDKARAILGGAAGNGIHAKLRLRGIGPGTSALRQG